MLDVGENEIIGDDGISMISEELKSLTELSVWGCGLSVKGEELINFVFFACTSFSEYIAQKFGRVKLWQIDRFRVFARLI